MYIGGLDIGTTGCKISVYDDKGSFVTNSYREYKVTRIEGDHSFDAEMIYDAVKEVIKEASGICEISAIGVTSFGESFVALDENDRALFPSMLYTDPHGEDECRALTEKLSEKRLIEISGVKPNAMYSLPKLMYLKANFPEKYAQIKRVLLMEDYIVYMLSGVAAIDFSLAARTMALDIRTRDWSREIFDAAGIEPSLFSTPVQAGNVAGEMLDKIKAELGIYHSLKIVNGSHDQVAATVGCGIFKPGEAMDGTGTVECIVPVFDSIPDNEALFEQGYSVVPFIHKGTYVCYALSFTGGAVLKWFRDNFAGNFEGEGNIYAKLDSSVGDDPTGILVLPHFAGAANPYMDNGSKAAFVGLTLGTTASDLYKALMEGVTYEMRTNLEQLESFGIHPEKIYATGGGATSKVWMQIKADILNRPISSLCAKEVGACGTCMLVGVGIGLYSNLDEAKKVFVKEKQTCLPDECRAEVYDRYFKAYRGMYSAVRPIIEEAKA